MGPKYWPATRLRDSMATYPIGHSTEIASIQRQKNHHVANDGKLVSLPILAKAHSWQRVRPRFWEKFSKLSVLHRCCIGFTAHPCCLHEALRSLHCISLIPLSGQSTIPRRRAFCLMGEYVSTIMTTIQSSTCSGLWSSKLPSSA